MAARLSLLQSSSSHALTSNRVSIVSVGPAEWYRMAPDVHRLELDSFRSSIRDSTRFYSTLLVDSNALFLALKSRETGAVIGFLIAGSLESFAHVPGLTNDPHFGRGDSLYIASIAIDRHWRNRGLGIALQRQFFIRAKKRGFSRALAHLRKGVLAKLGVPSRVLGLHPNWYNTRIAFELVEFTI